MVWSLSASLPGFYNSSSFWIVRARAGPFGSVHTTRQLLLGIALALARPSHRLSGHRTGVAWLACSHSRSLRNPPATLSSSTQCCTASLLAEPWHRLAAETHRRFGHPTSTQSAAVALNHHSPRSPRSTPHNTPLTTCNAASHAVMASAPFFAPM